MKVTIIKVLDIWEQLKTIDLILGIAIIGIFLIIAVSKAKARRTLIIDIPHATFGIFLKAIFQNKILGTVFLLILMASTWAVYFLSQSYTTALLFLIMPFKTILEELLSFKEDENKPIGKVFIKIFWEYGKSLIGWSVGYYLLILKLPTELKKIILYGFDNLKEGLLRGDLSTAIILILFSLVVSMLISIFITDMKRFAIIERDIDYINGKNKYRGLSKEQIQRVVVGTKYFMNAKVKVEVLRVIAGFNKYDFKDFRKLLKSSMKLYSFLKVKVENRKQFLNFIEKLLHCCDKHENCKDAVKLFKKGSREKAIGLMNNMDDFWTNECVQHICYNKKQECLDLMLKAVKK